MTTLRHSEYLIFATRKLLHKDRDEFRTDDSQLQIFNVTIASKENFSFSEVNCSYDMEDGF